MHRGPTLLGIAVVTLVYVGLHVYLWLRLVRSTQLSRRWAKATTALIAALGIYVPVSMMLARRGAGWPLVLLWPGMLWSGLALYLLLALLAADVGRWLTELTLWLAARRAYRRLVGGARLYRLGAALALLAAGALTLLGVLGALGDPVVRSESITLRRLAPRLDGFTIVQLSDLHAGRTIGRSHVERVVAEINEQNPDLVAITGDLVDGTVASLASTVAPLFDLHARHGVYFVPGNHDHYAGLTPWLAHLRRGGIHVLVNQSVWIGNADAGFCLAGVDDPRGDQDLSAALADCPPGRLVVLLAHRPEVVTEAAAAGVDLQLSGHTHGGQLWPFTFAFGHAVEHFRGRYQVGATTLYVSAGAGYIGPPLRLGAPPEIARLTLRCSPVPARP